MAGKGFNGGSDDFEEYDDPGYDEPEYDESDFDESDFEESDIEDSYYDDSDYDEALLLDSDEDSGMDSDYEEEDAVGEDYYDGLLPEDGDDDFIYDEEGNKELQPKVYYYKDEENYEEDMVYEEPEEDREVTEGKKKMSLLKKILIGVGSFVGVIIAFVLFSVFTPAGREIWYNIFGSYIGGKLDTVGNDQEKAAKAAVGITDSQKPGDLIDVIDNSEYTIRPEGPREEEYVTTYLIFGIEEIDGAANTDAIMLVSINKKDNTVKLTSIMRDTYVNIPGDNPNKINSVYAKGAKRTDDKSLKKAAGAALLVNVIENTFDVKIHGYACANFTAFQDIVDILGGIDLELGEKEARYLRKTNYISNPAYRTVQTGWNHMNGNQVLGYCRVRKVPTLGGADSDYGRTLRHRRVINAIISKFKSQSYFDMLPIMEKCLAKIYTNISSDQITAALRDVVENSIFTTASMRLPADELFKDSGTKGIYNGSSTIKYTLVLGDMLGQNIEKFHQFLFLDKEGETSTEAVQGAGAGVAFGSGGSGKSSVTPTPTPSPTPDPVLLPGQELIDESLPSSHQMVGAYPSSSESMPQLVPELLPEETIVSTDSAVDYQTVYEVFND